ncbi:hypothetical protein OAQ98_02930 [Alphaproteobacteria bacterium]|nr:hypothetical protein [Alphaproteobacteria bacterium]
MSQNNEQEVLKAYEQYLAFFLDNDMNGINSLVKFPITYIADGESKSLNAFPVTPKEMMDNKQWDTTIDTDTFVHGTNSTKGHIISSGTRIRKDKSVIEKYTVFYAFTKTKDGWKMYAISDVILD